jgi:pilus assembly protein FimV
MHGASSFSRGVLATALALAFLPPPSAFGLGLGAINLRSSLGQPLDAEIELLADPGSDTDTLQLSVGNAADYQAANLLYRPLPSGTRLSVVTKGNGSRWLRVTSREPVNEPFLELLLRANSGTLSVARNYTLLLDPPELTSPPQQVAAAQPVADPEPLAERPAPQRSSVRHARATQPVAHSAPASVDAASMGEYGPVQPGETLSGIAMRVRPAGMSMAQMVASLHAANPSAFIGGDVNLLRAGITLQLPGDTAAARAETPTRLAQAKPQRQPAPLTAEEIDAINPQRTAQLRQQIDILQKQVSELEATLATKTAELGRAAMSPATAAPAAIAPAPAKAPPPAGERLVALAGFNGSAPNAVALPASAKKADSEPGWPVYSTLSVLGLCGLLSVVALQRRRNRAQAMLAGDIPVTYVPKEEEPGDEHEASNPTSQLSSIDLAAARKSMGNTAIDPVDEAKVYLMFGRDREAEQLLREILQKDPSRQEAYMHLLMLYAHRKEYGAFDALARELHDITEGAGPVWQRVSSVGREFDADNPLYAGAARENRVLRKVGAPAAENAEVYEDQQGPSTRLDLARAYEKIGDIDLACAIVNRVIQESKGREQEEAMDLLKRLQAA